MDGDRFWADTLMKACGATPGYRLDDRQSKSLTLFILRQITTKPHRQNQPETTKSLQSRNLFLDVCVPRKRRSSPATASPVAKKPCSVPETLPKEPSQAIPSPPSPVTKKPSPSPAALVFKESSPIIPATVAKAERPNASDADDDHPRVILDVAVANREIDNGRKQRRVQPRREEEAVVTVVPLPNKFREAMMGMGLHNEDTIKFLVQKVLTGTDVGKTQNRLQIPVTKIKAPDFLEPEEERLVDSPEGMVVRVMEPSCEVCELRLRLWRMNKNKYYALVNKNQRSDDSPHKWHGLVTRNGIRQDNTVQVWSFRVGSESKLCLALVKV